MTKDQFGRRIRPSTAHRPSMVVSARRARQLKLAAGAAAVLAIGLAVIAATVK